MYPWEEGYLEVTGPGADKGTALQLIAQELGVAQKDVVAFGDGPNDVTMLRWAGYGVAGRAARTPGRHCRRRRTHRLARRPRRGEVVGRERF